MFSLIACAIFILACSYCTHPLENENQHSDLERGGERESGFLHAKNNNDSVNNRVCENKVLVIMAGNDEPTFIATPTCVTSSSVQCGVGNDSDKDTQILETCEGLKENINYDKATSTSSEQ
ncbi:hypothetical protein TanjilG_30681 [Lupinus angustifolius]|uniref:Secreted protein n=1 Tax=Lupinus angustifolius TaxID=3871 RepID=A0A4P1RPG0_LUPAN|nr:hypothetical protein TanjilG_30681 [Lupinus angustifolius]